MTTIACLGCPGNIGTPTENVIVVTGNYSRIFYKENCIMVVSRNHDIIILNILSQEERDVYGALCDEKLD